MPKIEDYALLGDLHTAALVSTAGSVDWLCLPRFDSPAVFAALLHNDQAGHWTLAPAVASECTTRRYAGNTLVLETDWVTADGAVRVIDFMPPRARHAASRSHRGGPGRRGGDAIDAATAIRLRSGSSVGSASRRHAKSTLLPGLIASGCCPRFRCAAIIGRRSPTSRCARAIGLRSSCRGRPAMTLRCSMWTPSRPFPRRRTSGPSGLLMPLTRPGRTATPSTGRSSP